MKIWETQLDDVFSSEQNYGIVKYAIEKTTFKDIPMSDGYYLHSANKTAIKSFDSIQDFRCSKYGFSFPTSIGKFKISSKNGTDLTIKSLVGNVVTTFKETHFNDEDIELKGITGDYISVISNRYGIDNISFEYDNINAFNVILGTICSQKFTDKWNRLYEALITKQYDVLNNQEFTETKTGNNSDKTTYDTTKTKIGNNSDTTTYDTSIVDDGNTGTNETTTTSHNNNDNVYGFNSITPVGDTTNEGTMTETVVGDANSNTSHNTQTKSGTEGKSFSINETDGHTGTDTKDITINETYTKTGRDISPVQLINDEVSMREKNIFFDIIYSDIDSIATLNIYI